MTKITIWEDTPKAGETYSGWFFSIGKNGHTVKIEGDFKTRKEAEDAAKRAVSN